MSKKVLSFCFLLLVLSLSLKAQDFGKIRSSKKAYLDSIEFLFIEKPAGLFEVYGREAQDREYTELFSFKSAVNIDSIIPFTVGNELFYKLFRKNRSAIVNRYIAGTIRSKRFYDYCNVLEFKVGLQDFHEQSLFVCRKNKKYTISYFDFEENDPGKYTILEGLDSFVVADKWHGIINYYKSGKAFTRYSDVWIPPSGGTVQSYNDRVLEAFRDSLLGSFPGYIIHHQKQVSQDYKQGYMVTSDYQDRLNGIKYEIFSSLSDTVLFLYKVKDSPRYLSPAVKQFLSTELPVQEQVNDPAFSLQPIKNDKETNIYTSGKEAKNYSYSTDFLDQLMKSLNNDKYTFLKDFDIWNNL